METGTLVLVLRITGFDPLLLPSRRTGATIYQPKPDVSRRDSPNGAYCALILAVRMTCPHFSVSSAMNFPNPVGVIGIGEAARSARRALKLGSARAASICRLSLSIISGAVFLGAPSPCQ